MFPIQFYKTLVKPTLWLRRVLIIREVNKSILVNKYRPRKHITEFNAQLCVALVILCNERKNIFQ